VSKWHQELGKYYSIENAILSNNFYHDDFIGPLFQLQMGTQRWIMVADPFIAHELFVNQSSKCSSPPYHTFSAKIYSKNNRYYTFSKRDTSFVYDFTQTRRGIIFSDPNSKWKSERKTGERKKS
jgi:hypothetical protein